MGGHGHHAPYVVPDASIYKVADVPQLVEVEKSLARQGLKDPWLRNEVWRYDKKHVRPYDGKVWRSLFRGFRLGFALFVGTIAVEQALGIDYHGGHGSHGHGDENGDGHHKADH